MEKTAQGFHLERYISQSKLTQQYRSETGARSVVFVRFEQTSLPTYAMHVDGWVSQIPVWRSLVQLELRQKKHLFR